jgi:adenosine/AMP kinase
MPMKKMEMNDEELEEYTTENKAQKNFDHIFAIILHDGSSNVLYASWSRHG